MSSQATEQDKKLNLEKMIAACDTAFSVNPHSLIRIEYLRRMLCVALHHKEQAEEFRKQLDDANEANDNLREKLDIASYDIHFLRGERDKLADELADRESLEDLSPFGKELVNLSEYHEGKLEALPPDDEADEIDPFKHQANSYKHGMGIDSFPLVQVEETLSSNDMGSYESWRRIAHAAVLAMSYLSYVANDGDPADEEEDDGDDSKSQAELETGVP